ncbi:hypothetical protein BDA99DRAFT_429586, partial [Phascolomyces articulosus]
LLEGLQTSLASYGQALDIGFFQELSRNLIMGTGYAVIDCHSEDETIFRELEHIIV